MVKVEVYSCPRIVFDATHVYMPKCSLVICATSSVDPVCINGV